MASVTEINNYLQTRLKELKLQEVDAVTAASWLEEAELLKDSQHRPGLPLRRHLRANQIIGAHQYPNRRWVIRQSGKEKQYTVSEAAQKLGVTEQTIYNWIEKKHIKYEILGEKRMVVNESEILGVLNERTDEQNHVDSGLVLHELNRAKEELKMIKTETEKIFKRLERVEKSLTKEKNAFQVLDSSSLIDKGFEGFKSIGSLMSGKCQDVPHFKGIYLVIYPFEKNPSFLKDNIGGPFKGRNPSVAVETLKSKWVPEANIIYIGQAGGGTSKATLHSRLKQYMNFGQGKPVGHWGGRFIWQLVDNHKLTVCWKITADQDPRSVERDLITNFISSYGKLPFANLTG